MSEEKDPVQEEELTSSPEEAAAQADSGEAAGACGGGKCGQHEGHGACGQHEGHGKCEKREKREKELEAARAEAADYKDKWMRTAAEFDNFRKRTEKEKSHMYEVGAKDVIEKILPVVDNFERGLASVPEDQKSDPVIDGMEKVYRQLMTILTDLGVTPIEAVGEEFDPNYHNAVMHVEDEELGENVVAEEFQKGYMYRDTVIRHSMVKVAN